VCLRELLPDPAFAALGQSRDDGAVAVDNHDDRSVRHRTSTQMPLQPVEIERCHEHADRFAGLANRMGDRERPRARGSSDDVLANDESVGEQGVAKIGAVADQRRRRDFTGGAAYHPPGTVRGADRGIGRQLGQHHSQRIAAGLGIQRLDGRQARQRDQQLPAAFENLQHRSRHRARVAQRIFVNLRLPRSAQVDFGIDLDRDRRQDGDQDQQKKAYAKAHHAPFGGNRFRRQYNPQAMCTPVPVPAPHPPLLSHV
jgi:hypothetical protein